MKKLIFKSAFLIGYLLDFVFALTVYFFFKESVNDFSFYFWLLLSVVFVCTSVICFFAARWVSNKLISGVEKINIEEPAYGENFKEFYSLIGRLKEQNKIIYEQKEDLRLRKKQFSAITDNMSEGFLLVDYNMQVLSFNQSAVKFLFGGEKVQSNLKKSSCEPRVVKSVENALAGERTEMLVEKDGIFIEIITSPVVSHGQVIGGVIIALDVTERHQRDELRKEFSANVSHELKTPLTSITGFAELMRDGLVEGDKIKEFSGDIYKEGHRLLSLVNDIIRLSKLDEGVAQPEDGEVELFALCKEVCDELKPIADEKQVELQLAGKTVFVHGVYQFLREMVFNLCDNAIKYNKIGGSVKVNVETFPNGLPFIKVSDTGIGIPISHQSRVFERFYRVDKSHSKEIGGTGLGLSIVKHSAAYHGATITLKSEVDVGTEITVTFKTE